MSRRPKAPSVIVKCPYCPPLGRKGPWVGPKKNLMQHIVRSSFCNSVLMNTRRTQPTHGEIGERYDQVEEQNTNANNRVMSSHTQAPAGEDDMVGGEHDFDDEDFPLPDGEVEIPGVESNQNGNQEHKEKNS